MMNYGGEVINGPLIFLFFIEKKSIMTVGEEGRPKLCRGGADVALNTYPISEKPSIQQSRCLHQRLSHNRHRDTTRPVASGNRLTHVT